MVEYKDSNFPFIAPYHICIIVVYCFIIIYGIKSSHYNINIPLNAYVENGRHLYPWTHYVLCECGAIF